MVSKVLTIRADADTKMGTGHLMRLENRRLRLRPVREDDARLLWEWANDPEVRAVSFLPQPVLWKQHLDWLRSKLKNEDCRFFLAIDREDEAVGQVRSCFCQGRVQPQRNREGAWTVSNLPEQTEVTKQMQRRFQISGRLVGPGEPVYIIAEMSANHRQKLAEAVKLVEAAKEAGADAVKVQTYTPDTLTMQSSAPPFHISGGLWDGRTLYDLYSEAYMPWEWLPKLKKLAGDLGLDFFSTAFDPSAVDFLEQHRVPAHKVASFEITDLPLISYMAKTGKPLFISTGMATLAEIDQAVRAARAGGAAQIALLKCTSAYPAPAEEINLRTIPNMAAAFGLPVGLSDHTAGIAVPVAAAALGACIVEKHFTLSRSLGGPDAAFSLLPTEFREMVDAIRITEKALGEVCYEAGRREAASRAFRRSLFVVRDLEQGEIFTPENLRSIRPGNGLSPAFLETVLGRRAACSIKRGTPLDWELLS